MPRIIDSGAQVHMMSSVSPTRDPPAYQRAIYAKVALKEHY